MRVLRVDFNSMTSDGVLAVRSDVAGRVVSGQRVVVVDFDGQLIGLSDVRSVHGGLVSLSVDRESLRDF